MISPKRRVRHRSATGGKEQNAVHKAPLEDVPQTESSGCVLNIDENSDIGAKSTSAVSRLGAPMNIQSAATLLGCSTWNIRHRLIPIGLPYFQVSPAGKLIFYRDQIIHWIEKQQKTGRLTKV